MRPRIMPCALFVLAAAGFSVGARGDDDLPLRDFPAAEAVLTSGLPTTSLAFVGIVPCRMADTRDLTQPPGYGPPALPSGSPRNFVLTNRCGIPATALAVSANVTAVNPAGPGFLLIRPTDGPNVLVSTLNFIPGQTVANAAAIPLGTGGGAMFLAGVTGTELIIDVNGYFVEGGVKSVNALSGDLTLAAGSNVTITPSGNTLTIASAGGGGGDITQVIAGTGLIGGGTSGSIVLSVNTAAIQSRISNSCPAGSSIRVIAADGSVTCEADDGLFYSTGSGLTQSGSVFATDNSLVARKDTAAGSQSFDAGTLFLDYTNNRVGIGQLAPTVPLDVAGEVRAADFTYLTPQTRQVIASPTGCISAASTAVSAPLLSEGMSSLSPPGNPAGPSIASTSGAANSTFNFHCSVPIQLPVAGTLTITGARLATFDADPNCRVQAQIVHKPFGSIGNGTVASTAFNGADAADFAALNQTGILKAFPAFTLAMPPDRLVWVNATIAFNATGNPNPANCRYSGVILDYTVTKP